MRQMSCLLARLLLAVPVLALPAQAAPSKPPRLAVILVVDQLSFDTLQQMRPRFGKNGLERILGEGALFTQAHYGHLSTFTGPGHACISSGSYPYKNGIVGNKYFERSRNKLVSMLADPGFPLLEAPISAGDDTSPANFSGETLGDRLRSHTAQKGKVVALSIKDRAAILLAGRQGQAYWFSNKTGRITSSTYYTKELPGWVKSFNNRKLPEIAFGKSWERALPEKDYFGEDAAAWEIEDIGLGNTFPHPLTGKLEKPGPAYYDAFTVSSFGVDYTVELVKAAVEAEGLGRDGVPDLLAVSFTSIDYAGHLFGPDSHEVQDLLVRLDRAVAQLLPILEKAAGGKQNLVVGLVADHGVAPVPERMASLGHPAARIGRARVAETIDAALQARFGPGNWVTAVEPPGVYLDPKVVADRKADPAEVQRIAGEAALTMPGMQAYFTRAQLAGGKIPGGSLGQAAHLAFHPRYSGDLLLVSAPFVTWGQPPEHSHGTGHGSPWRYDTHVPMAFWGAGIRPGTYRERTDVADFAPTLAELLGIGAPAAADGFPLARALK